MGWRKRKRRSPLKHWYRRHAATAAFVLGVLGAVIALGVILIELREEALATPTPLIE